jgi:hypothetical protein
MSKKFRGKKCVYCCAAVSVTADHVFARELFLKSRRANLPKVPACNACNQKKSVLEHYVTTLLPFLRLELGDDGAPHASAQSFLGVLPQTPTSILT